MKKILTIIIFSLIGNFTYSQKIIKSECSEKFSCSQKFGLTETKSNYTLIVSIDDKDLKFKTAEKQIMTSFSVAKKTDKYVIGKNESGNYSFYDLKKKQFYYIDYYMSRYSTAGYGVENSEIKQTVLKMMELLKKGNTQKDVIQHLVKQTEYDF